MGSKELTEALALKLVEKACVLAKAAKDIRWGSNDDHYFYFTAGCHKEALEKAVAEFDRHALEFMKSNS